MPFLFDENLPRRLSDSLTSLNLPCEHVEQHGLTNTPDIEIFAYCSTNGLVLVSRDLRIHRDKTEAAALQEASIGVVEVDFGKMPLRDQAIQFLKAADKLEPLLQMEPPFHYILNRSGLRSAQEVESRKARRRRK